MTPGLSSPPRFWTSSWQPFSVFVFIMFLTWLDQGTIGSNGVTGTDSDGLPGIVQTFGLTSLQAGVIPAVYTLGLMLAAFAFAELCGYVNAQRLVGIGVLLWVAAMAGAAFSFSYWFLLLTRLLAGAGEAAVITLTFPFVDDFAPARWKTLYFATFAIAQTLGIAVGLMFGGLVGPSLGWRWCFGILAFLGVPPGVLLLVAPPLALQHVDKRGAADGSGAGPSRKAFSRMRELWRDVATCARYPAWHCSNWAVGPQYAVFSVLGFWGPKAARVVYGAPQAQVDLSYGAITVVTGIFATLAGGIALDRLGSTLPRTFRLGTASLAVALAALLGACWAGSFAGHMAAAGLGLAGMFTAQGPAWALSMWTVPPSCRPVSQAVFGLTMHVLGDLFAAPAAGAMFDALEPRDGGPLAWRLTLTAAVSYLAAAVAAYGAGALLGARAVDHRDSADQTSYALADSDSEPPSSGSHGLDTDSEPQVVGAQAGTGSTGKPAPAAAAAVPALDVVARDTGLGV